MAKMITIIGPTASGKTALAAHLAASFIAEGQPAEIISGDSRQVYRGMDIGTGKDLCDYTVELPTPTTYHPINECKSTKIISKHKNIFCFIFCFLLTSVC